MNNAMLYISSRTKILIAFVAIVGIGIVLGRWNLSSGKVPAEFREARLQGAVISQDIVNLSNDLAKDLERINQLDANQDLGPAIKLTEELVAKNEEIKKKAVELSSQLEKMISGLSSIESERARQAALESIASRMAIIGRLLSYSDYIGSLLSALQSRFNGTPTDVRVKTLIDQINAEVIAINNFNKQAVDAMNRFDRLAR